VQQKVGKFHLLYYNNAKNAVLLKIDTIFPNNALMGEKRKKQNQQLQHARV
jgi:hypothetical protein